MEQQVQVRFRLTAEVILEGTLEVGAQEVRFFRYLKVIGMTVLPAVLLTSLFSFKAFITVLPFGIMALFFILVGPLQVFLLKRQIPKMKILNEDICWTFSTTGTEQVTNESKSQETWKLYHKAVRTKKGFLIYPQEKVAYWIPFTAFSSVAEIEAVDTLIADHIKTYRRT